VDDERVDQNLVVAVVQHIHTECGDDGAVLVFLPGYDDIVGLKVLS
jgi:HrpA-like RNA helicase